MSIGPGVTFSGEKVFRGLADEVEREGARAVQVHRRQVTISTEGLGGQVSRLEHVTGCAQVTARAVLARLPETARRRVAPAFPKRARRGRSCISILAGCYRDRVLSRAGSAPWRSPPILVVACWRGRRASRRIDHAALATLRRHQHRCALACPRCRRSGSRGRRPRRLALPPGMLGRRRRPARLGRSGGGKTRLRARRQREIADLGADLDELARRLAQRWGCDPLVVDAVWLHSDRERALHRAAAQPGRLALHPGGLSLGRADPVVARAEGPHDQLPAEPRLRILIAEVQARCGRTVRRGRRHAAGRKTAASERPAQNLARRRAAGAKSERSFPAGDG